jgi:hypothetical protein
VITDLAGDDFAIAELRQLAPNHAKSAQQT